MPHIDFMPGLPGIRGPMAFSPETARPLNDLVNVLLRANANHPESTLSEGERELIATYVSARNDCFFCQTIHGAVASHHLGDTDWSLVQSVKQDYAHAAVSDKLKALLAIAGSVQQGGKHVTADQIERARTEGATDRDIHDTVLIAAAFCMFNRYVDGLDTWAPESPDLYRYRAQKVAEYGYTHEDHYLPPF
ncbi:MAG: carboxymuconolactone decarboxylase family protein [Cytophagaceae bacterium]|nr:MAG: carboxymuconolactone decarboxylase family protein [Cytophagaceae bacterium]